MMELQLKTAWGNQAPEVIQELVTGLNSIVMVRGSSKIQVLDATGKIKRELQGQQAGISCTALSAKGTELIAGGNDGFLKWLHLETGEETCCTQIPRDSSDSAPSSGSSHAVSAVICSKKSNVAAACNRSISIFGSGGEHLHTLPALPHAVTSLMWINESLVAAVAGPAIYTWTMRGQEVTAGAAYVSSPPGDLSQLAVSRDGSQLAAASASMIHVWSMQGVAGEVQPAMSFQLPRGIRVTWMEWSKQGQHLAAALGSQVFIWNTAMPDGLKGHVVLSGLDGSVTITGAAFQASGPLLVVTGDNGQVVVFDLCHINGRTFGSVIPPVSSTHLPGLGKGPRKVMVAWQSHGMVVAAAASGAVTAFDLASVANDSRAQSGEVPHAPPPRPARGRYEKPSYNRNSDGPAPAANGASQPAVPPPSSNSSVSAAQSNTGGAAAAGAAPAPVPAPAAPPPAPPPAAPPAAPAPPPPLQPPLQQQGSGLFNGKATPKGSRNARVAKGPPPPGAPPPSKQFSGGSHADDASDKSGPTQQAVPGSVPAGWGMVPTMVGGHPMRWSVQPMPYVMYPQGVAGPMHAMPPMAQYMQPGPVPAGVRPMAAPPSATMLSSSVYSPSAAAAAASAAAAGMPMAYMYPQQYMAYMPQWPGYYYPYQMPGTAGAVPVAHPGGMPAHMHPAAAPPASPSVSTTSQTQGGSSLTPARSTSSTGLPDNLRSPMTRTSAAGQHGSSTPLPPRSNPMGPRASASGTATTSANGSAASAGGYSTATEVAAKAAAAAAAAAAVARVSLHGSAGNSRPGSAPGSGTPSRAVSTAGNDSMAGQGLKKEVATSRLASESGTTPSASANPGSTLGTAAAPAPSGPKPPSGPPPSGTGPAGVRHVNPGQPGAHFHPVHAHHPQPQQQQPNSQTWFNPAAQQGRGGPRDGDLRTVYVGNLANTVDETALHMAFAYYGPVENVQVIRDRETKETRGYGFVTFAHPMFATNVMHQLDGAQMGGAFQGKIIKVSPSRKTH